MTNLLPDYPSSDINQRYVNAACISPLIFRQSVVLRMWFCVIIWNISATSDLVAKSSCYSRVIPCDKEAITTDKTALFILTKLLWTGRRIMRRNTFGVLCHMKVLKLSFQNTLIQRQFSKNAYGLRRYFLCVRSNAFTYYRER